MLVGLHLRKYIYFYKKYLLILKKKKKKKITNRCKVADFLLIYKCLYEGNGWLHSIVLWLGVAPWLGLGYSYWGLR